jgi:hypothetical protein
MEWDASEGNPGQSCVHLYPRILSTSFTSVSIFSVWCYSSVSYLNGKYTLLHHIRVLIRCVLHQKAEITRLGAGRLAEAGRTKLIKIGIC